MSDIGIFNPSATQDVAFVTAPVDTGGQPTHPALSWALNGQGNVGTLQVAPDNLSAKLVTPDGDFAATVTVTTPEGIQDTAAIIRQASVTTVIGLSASLVDKGQPAPARAAAPVPTRG